MADDAEETAIQTTIRRLKAEVDKLKKEIEHLQSRCNGIGYAIDVLSDADREERKRIAATRRKDSSCSE